MKREIKFRGIPIPEFKGYAIDGFVRDVYENKELLK